MQRKFFAAASVWTILLGLYLIQIDQDLIGCAMCGTSARLAIAVISLLVGAAGLVLALRSPEVALR